ncbi:hypothetical protein C8R43DRAFT_1002838 [Mycena crocata]|nr:hypothetical protein C8R43DRAFT_1002838 [Mycena crocata]
MPSLPDLPTELLMEMVKYYPELLLEIDANIHGVASEQLSGNDALRALSQTCSRLRDVFLPVLWSRVYACFTARNRPKRKPKRRAKMLERRMLGIQKTPHVVPYIQTLSVTMEECDMGNWEPVAQFIRVLNLLPDLRQLTIIRPQTGMVPVIATSCKDKIFPSVVGLAIPDILAPILHCFPNVQTLTSAQLYRPSSNHLLDAAKGLEHIHTVNLPVVTKEIVNRLRDNIPNVKRLSLWRDLNLDVLSLLDGMENLSELHIRYRPLGYHYYGARALTVEEIMPVAERVLRTSKAKGRKELRIQCMENNHKEEIIQEETVLLVGGSR